MDRHIIEFLEKSVLGRDTKFGNPASVIKACISKAYQDMNTAGRFVVIPNTKESICKGLYDILVKHRYAFSVKIIDEAELLFGADEILSGSNNRQATRFGLAQKLVNMTYKYFYAFYDYIDVKIDFSKCDCPIDSIVLEKIKEKDIAWSRLDKKTYTSYQGVIEDLMKEEANRKDLGIGRMEYDFTHCW